MSVDNCEVPEDGIDYLNRGEFGSGHRWITGFAVIWNSSEFFFINQGSLGAANWVIGGKGEHHKMEMPFDKESFQPDGFYDASEQMITPKSLYLNQLSERLSLKVVKNISY